MLAQLFAQPGQFALAGCPGMPGLLQDGFQGAYGAGQADAAFMGPLVGLVPVCGILFVLTHQAGLFPVDAQLVRQPFLQRFQLEAGNGQTHLVLGGAGGVVQGVAGLADPGGIVQPAGSAGHEGGLGGHVHAGAARRPGRIGGHVGGLDLGGSRVGRLGWSRLRGGAGAFGSRGVDGRGSGGGPAGQLGRGDHVAGACVLEADRSGGGRRRGHGAGFRCRIGLRLNQGGLPGQGLWPGWCPGPGLCPGLSLRPGL